MAEKDDVLKYIGNLAQLGGSRHYELTRGWGTGMRCIDVVSGKGLQYTVIPDRGMDISLASYKGTNLVYLTPNSETHPAYYDPEKAGWLRTFAGGLITTCGLTYLGPPVVDEGEELGLHGRYSTIPAAQVADISEWVGDDYHILLKGVTEEGHLFGHKLRLERQIETILGQNSIRITDKITNFGYKPSPFTIMYHMNFGYPLIDENTVLDFSSRESTPRDEQARLGVDEMKSFSKPTPDFSEQVFIHKMRAADGKYAEATLKNKKLGIGLSLKFDVATLPYMTQWKMMGQGDYVLGLEPSNVPLGDRKQLREKNLLPMLKPGEITVNILEITLTDI